MIQSREFIIRPVASILLTAMLFHQFAFAQITGQDKVIIAIVDFKNTGADSSLDYLTGTIPESISTSMAKSGRLEIVERSRLEAALNEMQMSEVGIVDESQAAELGRAVGANAILVGSYVSIGTIIRINSRLIDVQTSRVLKAEMVQGTVGTEIFDMMDEMAASIEYQLLGPPPGIDSGPLADKLVDPIPNPFAKPVTGEEPAQPATEPELVTQPPPSRPAPARQPVVTLARSGGAGFALLLLLAAAGGAAYYFLVLEAPGDEDADVTVNVSIEP